MSLLDDVSIVVTPNGYKAGTLFGVIPVPTLGSEEITNGDLATDTDWDKATGVTISGGRAIFNNSTANNNGLFQNAVFQTNTKYKITAEVSNYSSGNVTAWAGSSQNSTSNESFTGNGIKTWYINTGGTNSYFLLSSATTNGNFDIDNVSVKEYTAADMDVTRATAATRVDEAGLVNYAEILGSEEVTNGGFVDATGWTISGAWSLGTNKVIFSDTTNGDIRTSSAIFTATKTYQIKLTVADLTGANTAFFAIGDGSASNLVGYDNYANGDYTFNAIAPNGSELRIFSTTSSGSSYSITNISVKEVTRDNVPRIDYTGGGCPHILAEPQRTNLITYSSDFTDSSWSKSAAGTGVVPVVTSNYGLSPDGTQNADRIQFDLNGGTGGGDLSYISDFYTATGVSSTNSIYLKSLSSTKNIRLRCGGTFLSVDVTDDWQRFDITDTSSSNRFQLLLYGNLNSQDADLLVWGGQAEEGSYATSYIPTSGGTVTRNQDIFTRDGIGSLINSEEGVLFLEMAALADDGTNRYISISDGGITNYIYFRFMTTSNRVLTRTAINSVTINTFQKTISDTTTLNKYALKWKSGDYALWINGVEEVVGTEASTFPSGVLNTIKFGFPTSLGDGIYSKVKQLQIFKTALTDSELATLTT